MIGWEEIALKAKLLLVDDDSVMIQLSTAMLRKAGYTQIWSTQDPAAARQLFLEIRPDLVLLDMNMVPLNGMEVMRQLQAEIPEGEYVPIVMITADASKELRLEALDKGAKDFMTKPVEWSEAMLRIRTRLESRFRFVEMQRTIEQLRQGSASPTRVSNGAAPAKLEGRAVVTGSGSPAPALLLQRLDRIAELIDSERYADAREKLRGTRWLMDVDVATIPGQVLKRAQQWVDTGHDALSGSDLDFSLARNALLQARRVIAA